MLLSCQGFLFTIPDDVFGTGNTLAETQIGSAAGNVCVCVCVFIKKAQLLFSVDGPRTTLLLRVSLAPMETKKNQQPMSGSRSDETPTLANPKFGGRGGGGVRSLNHGGCILRG